MTPALELHLHPAARQALLEHGLQPQLFSLFVGASGGAKWLVLSQLDRVLMPWLCDADRDQPLSSVGSSIGAWRAICLAQQDPAAAIERLETGYIEQAYAERPTPDDISTTSESILIDVLGKKGTHEVISNPAIRTHIITARGLGGWSSQERRQLLRAGARTVLANTLSRQRLSRSLERRVFHTGDAALLEINDRFPTRQMPLSDDNLVAVTRASGSIPLIMRGVEHIVPGEVHWDGGMTDYHFGGAFRAGDGLTLYPHFYPHFSPGWFDKAIRWRRARALSWPGLVLMCPSKAFVASLPGGRIPNRKDFQTMETAARKKAWWQVVDAGKRLADEFMGLLDRGTLERRLAGQ